MVYVLIGLSRLSLLMQNAVTAADYLQASHEIMKLRETSDPKAEKSALELDALVASSGGRKDDASKWLASVIAFYRAQEWQVDLARALRERVETGINDSTQQDKLDLAEAKAILTPIAPASFEMGHLEMVEGNLYYGSGDDKAAEPHYRAALKLLSELAPHSLGVAALRMNLGKTLRHLSPSIQDAAERQRILAESDELIALGWRQARDLQSQFYGDESSQAYADLLSTYATDYAELQIANADPTGAFATLESSRALGLEQLLLEHRKLSGDLWKMHKYLIAQRHKTEADYETSLNRRQAASAAVHDVQQAQPVDQNKLDKAYTALDATVEDEGRALFLYIDQLVKYDEFWSQLQKELATSNAPQGSAAKTVAATSPAMPEVSQYIAQVPKGTTFVMFAIGRTHVLALAVRGGESQVLSSVIDQNPAAASSSDAQHQTPGLSQQVHKFVDRVQQEPPRTDVAAQNSEIGQAGRQLFARLFPGTLAQAALESEHLVISPDGFLWRLPFAALATGKDAAAAPAYLGLAKPITYAQSLRLFERASQAGSAPGKVEHALVVGDPKFDVAAAPAASERGGEIGSFYTPDQLWGGFFTREQPPLQLKATRQEASDVACYLGAKPLMDSAATEEEIRKQVDDADIIHLATHGVLLSNLPMSSGLVFTPPADTAHLDSNNDGALQAWEIFSQLQLKAKMVVLSACETAKGWDIRGEGVIGLTRAFQYAGADSILATLWTIDDRSTSALMREFYARLIDGKSKDQALQDGMRKLAAGGGARGEPYWTLPYYWAPFTLIGDPGPLTFAAAKPNCE